MLGKAGQRLLAGSALVEAETQFKRALMQIAELPGTPTLRREQIALRIGIGNALEPVREQVEWAESFVIEARRPDSSGVADVDEQENRGRYDRRRLRYPSDVTDEEWALVEPLIPPAKRRG